MCRALGLEDFLAVDVYHRTRCYGAVLRHTDGWSIVYVCSGLRGRRGCLSMLTYTLFSDSPVILCPHKTWLKQGEVPPC